MPPLVRLYTRSIGIGVLLAVVFTGLLIWMDVANLRHLILETPGGVLATAMLIAFNAIVFSGVQFGIAVMRMAEAPKPPKTGRPVAVSTVPVAVTAAASSARGRSAG